MSGTNNTVAAVLSAAASSVNVVADTMSSCAALARRTAQDPQVLAGRAAGVLMHVPLQHMMAFTLIWLMRHSRLAALALLTGLGFVLIAWQGRCAVSDADLMVAVVTSVFLVLDALVAVCTVVARLFRRRPPPAPPAASAAVSQPAAAADGKR